jgi:hypothetical protein
MIQSYADLLRLADSNTKSAAQQVRKRKIGLDKNCFLFFSA